MLRAMVIGLLLVALSSAVQAEPPRGAAVYSAFKDGAYWYQGDQEPVFTELGWPLTTFENTHIADLVASLAEYDLVVMGTGYNIENSQDFGQYGAQWRAWVEAGGCLVVTDANYGPMFYWLSAVDPALKWGCAGAMNEWREAPPSWVAADHPLMQGVQPQKVPWTYPVYWSQAYTPLLADKDRRPIIAYQEISKGIVVVSSAYRQYSFPSPRFLNNLMAWVKSPERLAAANQRQVAALAARNRLPEVTFPRLPKAPILDGDIDEAEWEEATTLPDFVAMDGTQSLTQRTSCRVGQTSQGLYLAFECWDSDLAGLSPKVIQRDGPVWTDDCVEVFLAPATGRVDYLHFAVNAAGVQYDERGADAFWDRYWLVKTGRAPGRWTAELFLPFSALELRADDPADLDWTGNFYREYPGRGPLPGELSGWSPTFGNFARPAYFGKLLGIEAPLEKYKLAPELELNAPERWFSGTNPVTVAATALPGQQADFFLQLEDVGGQAPPVALPRTQLEAGQQVELTVDVRLETDASRAFQIVARDAVEPDRILASSRVFQATPEPVLELTLLSPVFRNTVQSRDPDKTLHLTGSLGDPGEYTGELTLRASLIPEGCLRPLWQQSQPVSPRAEVSFEGSLEAVEPGEYELQIDLEDEAQQLIARDRHQIKVTPPAPVEVTFDTKRACLVNGKPIFPIGLYHVSEPALDLVNARAKELGLPQLSLDELLTSCKDHGFNTVVRSWGMPSEEYMEIAQRLGLWVLPEIGAPGEAELKQYVDFVNRYDNLLAWYGVDEPSGEKLRIAMEAHERFARVDPHRPVSAACNNPGVFENGVQAYDFLMMDPYLIYPKRGPSLAPIAEWVEAGLRAGKGKVAIWVVPQAFAIDNAWAEPTNEELRCQAYLSIVHGATGLVWYAWYTTEPWSENASGRNQWLLPDSPMWPYFTKLNAEITELAPVFLQAERHGLVKCDKEVIHTQLWEEADGSRLLVAVNPRAEELSCTLSGLAGESADVLFEDRSLPLEAGAFSDTFSPLSVHVYRLK